MRVLGLEQIEQIYDSMLDSLSENIEFLKVPVRFDRLTPDAKFALKEYEDWACERIWESKAALAYVAMHADDAMPTRAGVATSRSYRVERKCHTPSAFWTEILGSKSHGKADQWL